MDWIYLVHGMDKWRAVVNTVTNFSGCVEYVFFG